MRCTQEGATTHAAAAAVPGLKAWTLALIGAAALVAAPRQAQADAYKDEKLGFSLDAPAKWNQMPISTDERWRVAEWQSAREYDDEDAKTNSRTRHRPKLDVVVIPNSVAAQKGAEVRQDGDKVVVVRQAPWRDLKEYMDKTTQEAGLGGYFFSKEEETKVGAMKVMVYEITVDKFTSTRNNSPRKIYGWAFYGEDAVYGLVGDSLVKFEDKVKPELDAAARSFKVFTRTGTLPGAEVTPGDGGDVVVKKDPKKEHVSDAELKKRRVEAFNQRLAKIKETLPKDWKVKESENFTAVWHCDEAFAAEVLDRAEALRAWLDQNLGFVGAGYAGKIILRVCADDDERRVLADGIAWSAAPCEVVTCETKTKNNNKLRDVNHAVFAIWMRDKNARLSWSLPPWIASGLDGCVGSAVSKGRRITDFETSQADNLAMANLRRADKLLDAHAFFTMDRATFGKAQEGRRQAEFFTRWLLVGGAQRDPRYRNVLADYLKGIVVLLDEQDDAKPKEDVKPPQNEEEEQARQRARAEAWKALEEETLKKLVLRTFPGWDDAKWDSFDAAYWKELGA